MALGREGFEAFRTLVADFIDEEHPEYPDGVAWLEKMCAEIRPLMEDADATADECRFVLGLVIGPHLTDPELAPGLKLDILRRCSAAMGLRLTLIQ